MTYIAFGLICELCQCPGSIWLDGPRTNFKCTINLFVLVLRNVGKSKLFVSVHPCFSFSRQDWKASGRDLKLSIEANKIVLSGTSPDFQLGGAETQWQICCLFYVSLYPDMISFRCVRTLTLFLTLASQVSHFARDLQCSSIYLLSFTAQWVRTQKIIIHLFNPFSAKSS